jgi:hypothetical protein
MSNATLVKITRYGSLLCCGMFAGIAVTVRLVEGVSDCVGEPLGVRSPNGTGASTAPG